MENQTTQNSIPEPVLTSDQVEVVENKPKSSSILLVTLVLLSLLSLASTVFLYYQNMQLKNTLANYQTQPMVSLTPILYPSPVPSTTTDPTANWKVLQTINLYLRYPDALIGCAKDDPIFESLNVRTTENCNSSGAPENIIGISKISNPNEDQLYKYLGNLNIGDVKPGMTEGEKMAGVEYKRMNDLVIGNLTANTYIQSSKQNTQNNVSTIYSYVKSQKDEIYLISETYINSYPNKFSIDFAKTFNQILSTFKFTN